MKLLLGSAPNWESKVHFDDTVLQMKSIQQTTPALRFKDEQGKDYPDWDGNTLGMLFEISAGGDFEKSHSRKIKDGIFRYPIYANSEKAKGLHGYSDKYRVKQNCITVSGRGTLGVAHARFENFFPIVRLLVLIPRKESNLIFFEHAINLLQIFNESTGVPQLTAPQLKKYSLNCPSINEQQYIASFLSSVDTKIEQLSEKKELLELYKKGMMQKLFSQEIRFKDERGNDFPDWGERRFDEIANIIMGTSPKSSAYNHSMNGLPLIQGNADVKNRKSAPRIYTSEITKECLPNDTLLSVRAPVGEVSRAIHHACIGRGISAVRVKAISVQDYIFHYLVWYEPRWKGLSQGSTFESVNTKSIESLKILVPSKLEQQKIADFLSAIDKKIDLVAEQLEQARTFKKGLLQRMFI